MKLFGHIESERLYMEVRHRMTSEERLASLHTRMAALGKRQKYLIRAVLVAGVIANLILTVGLQIRKAG